MSKVSCIICAYNEAPRIGTVLDAVKDNPLIGEIVVVDDGSTDNTVEVVRSYSGVRLVALEKNAGKSSAFAAGIEAAQFDTVLMLDADLVGLQEKDVTSLIEPVLRSETDVTLSIRENTMLTCKWLGLEYISGERVFPRSLLAHDLESLRAIPGFGLEVYMNEKIIEKGLRIKSVWWSAVRNPGKARKFGFVRGTARQLGMVVDMLRVVSLWTIVRQNYQMVLLSRER